MFISVVCNILEMHAKTEITNIWVIKVMKEKCSVRET